jgi:hypothetical protein
MLPIELRLKVYVFALCDREELPLLRIDNTGCISGRDNSIFLNSDRLIATEEG